MPEIRAKIAARIREHRELAGLSQRELGKKAGLSSSFVGVIETGKSGVNPDKLARIAKALDVDIAALTDGAPVVDTGPALLDSVTMLEVNEMASKLTERERDILLELWTCWLGCDQQHKRRGGGE